MNCLFGSSAEDDFEFIQQAMDNFDRDLTGLGSDVFGIANGTSAGSRGEVEETFGEGKMELESHEQNQSISDNAGSPHEGIQPNFERTEGRGEAHDVTSHDARQHRRPRQSPEQKGSGEKEAEEDITRDEEGAFASSSDSNEENERQESGHTEVQEQGMIGQDTQVEYDRGENREVEEGEKGMESEGAAQNATTDAKRHEDFPLHGRNNFV